MKVKVNGSSAKRMLKEKMSLLDKAVKVGLIEIGLATQKEVKGIITNKHIIDTGQLRRSIKVDRGELQRNIIKVIAATDYAVHVEYGHRQFIFGRDSGKWTEGRFFMRDGLAAVDFEKIMRGAILKLVIRK